MRGQEDQGGWLSGLREARKGGWVKVGGEGEVDEREILEKGREVVQEATELHLESFPE